MDRPGPVDYDAELQRHSEVLRRACGVESREHVLDIGCGSGQTTREAARMARAGSALGIDISAAAIERARELAAGGGACAMSPSSVPTRRSTASRRSASTWPSSSFGTMFFPDPVAAFANVGRALRPAGRLVMMVWQAPERNEWEVAISQSLGRNRRISGRRFRGPGSVLARRSAGRDRRSWRLRGSPASPSPTSSEPVYYGSDVAAALDWVRGFACTREALDRLDPAAEARADGRLREMLAAHLSGDGVWFDSRAWIVTARRK